MLTALSAEAEIIRGLGCGADDYVIKPFSPSILLARIEAVLCRTELSLSPRKLGVYNDGYLTIDLEAHRVFVRKQPVRLSKTEYRLLAYLLQHADRVLTFRQILNHVWGTAYLDDIANVHVYISCLRRKLEYDVKNPTYLLTEYGVGYRFEKHPADSRN
jgi:two-component system KDP operon response regulator KdpE